MACSMRQAFGIVPIFKRQRRHGSSSQGIESPWLNFLPFTDAKIESRTHNANLTCFSRRKCLSGSISTRDDSHLIEA